MEEVVTDDGDSGLPFSDAIIHGDTVYVSGRGPRDLETGEIVGNSAGEQTRQTLKNVAAVLEAAGSSLDRAVKVTVYLRDMDDYQAVNEVYAEYVSHPFPARTTVQVVEFPVDIDVEIDVIAAV